MEDTPRPGPFDQFTFRAELIADILDIVSFLKRMSDEIDTADLSSMSEAQLEAEYRRVCRYLATVLRRMKLQVSREDSSMGESAGRWHAASAHYSPCSGLHISERSG